MSDKVLVLNGNTFSSIEEFYEEIYKILTFGLDWKVAHNFDALNDILYGDFGVFSSKEIVTLKWLNYTKSKKDLGKAHSIEYYKMRAAGLTKHRSAYFLQKATDLEMGKGNTLIETILEVIADHPNILLKKQE